MALSEGRIDVFHVNRAFHALEKLPLQLSCQLRVLLAGHASPHRRSSGWGSLRNNSIAHKVTHRLYETVLAEACTHYKSGRLQTEHQERRQQAITSVVPLAEALPDRISTALSS